MKAYTKSKISKETICRKEYKVETRHFKDWYSNADQYYYKQEKWKTNGNRRLIMMYQVRMYKTWKHNRNTQWK